MYRKNLNNHSGSAAANDLLDLFNSKFIFRVGDQQTAHRSAMILGEQEIRKTQESLSYGSNTIRDGVNINTIEQKKMQVLPAEIMSLPNLSCFVKLAEHYPISKLNMTWQN
ncbi:MAG TPA: type IV secretion system DNA-binding domain-containing protein [Rickettsia endosymbiont of Bembidion nr. Transversale]|nr:type IV secretion system DNA-binding domain-containing protein [Rickettsia endosymbiont of Bembidion nr. Transversale]